MPTIEEAIEVRVPVRTAYNQWTQFEEFPRFMEGVEEVRQVDDTHLHWVAQIAGRRREWDAEITEQRPDLRVAWHAEGAIANAGAVTFHKIDDDTTRVMVQMKYEPGDAIDKVGEWLGLVERRLRGDLERFKGFVESRGGETGGWRGEVEEGRRIR